MAFFGSIFSHAMGNPAKAAPSLDSVAYFNKLQVNRPSKQIY